MIGGLGNDTYYVDNSSDLAFDPKGWGVDTVYTSVHLKLYPTSQIEAVVATGTANVNLTGNAFPQKIYGNAGANRLMGGDGNDILLGGLGNDRLAGGLRADKLYGGIGDDVYLFDSKLSSTNIEQALSAESGPR